MRHHRARRSCTGQHLRRAADVTDDRIVRGVKEKTIESVADHCAAKIGPPWVPEIITVPLGQGSDLYILVLRAVPGHHSRPLLVGGVAYIRRSWPDGEHLLYNHAAERGAAVADWFADRLLRNA